MARTFSRMTVLHSTTGVQAGVRDRLLWVDPRPSGQTPLSVEAFGPMLCPTIVKRRLGLPGIHLSRLKDRRGNVASIEGVVLVEYLLLGCLTSRGSGARPSKLLRIRLHNSSRAKKSFENRKPSCHFKPLVTNAGYLSSSTGWL